MAGAAFATPQIDPMFGDHAVIQSGAPLRLFGTAAPGESLKLQLGSRESSTRADSAGRWTADIASPTGSGPFDLTVTGAGGVTAKSHDLLIGDVWLCSGQSNMELPVSRALNADTEVAGSADEQLRLVSIEKKTLPAPGAAFDKPPAWAAASPANVAPFSAACYFMGRQLRHDRHIPIGLINATWGGTAIRSWMDPESASRAAAKDAALLKLFETDAPAANREFGPRWEAWWLSTHATKPWDGAPLDWKPMKVGYWETWGDPAMAEFNGFVWARATVNLTAAEAAQTAQLKLGVIDEIDQTWVNGIPVGNTYGWTVPRTYLLPRGTLHAGANSVVVGVLDTYGFGGFQGPASAMAIVLDDGTTKPLAPTLQYSVARDVSGDPPRPPWDSAAGLALIYNGMIAPLGTPRLKGVAWYQGEAEAGMSEGYDNRLSSMMAGWRKQFQTADLPFLIVGLPGWGPPHIRPVASGWAEVRDAQKRVAASDAHAAFVPAMDLGDRLELHPAQKQAVGARLAAAAEAIDAGRRYSGPQAASARRDGNDVLVSFYGVTGQLHGWSGAPLGLELCGPTQLSCRFATAAIENAGLRVRGDGKPITRVRYAWSDAPVVNLYDDATLPVSSFELAVH